MKKNYMKYHFFTQPFYYRLILFFGIMLQNCNSIQNSSNLTEKQVMDVINILGRYCLGDEEFMNSKLSHSWEYNKALIEDNEESVSLYYDSSQDKNECSICMSTERMNGNLYEIKRITGCDCKTVVHLYCLSQTNQNKCITCTKKGFKKKVPHIINAKNLKERRYNEILVPFLSELFDKIDLDPNYLDKTNQKDLEKVLLHIMNDESPLYNARNEKESIFRILESENRLNRVVHYSCLFCCLGLGYYFCC